MKSLREVITIDNILSWSSRTKTVVFALLFFVLLLLGYFFVVRPELFNTMKLRNQENNLREQYAINYKRLLRAKAYKQQANKLNKQFEVLSLKLPKKVQMSTLLRSISSIGKDSGLHFNLFDPLKTEIKEKYIILPINISVEGSYHQLANFINSISRLDRLITFESFMIKILPAKGKQAESLQENKLDMSLLLFVYYQRVQVNEQKGGA